MSGAEGPWAGLCREVNRLSKWGSDYAVGITGAGSRPLCLTLCLAEFGSDSWREGSQRRIGLRAAPTSSRRRTRVECGAVLTRSGLLAASSAIERMASMKKSHSSFDSDSVGSIINAPGTIRGKAVVYGWKP